MKTSFWRVVAPLLGLGAFAGISSANAAEGELKVGDKAPAFTLMGSDGKTYSLDQFKGKTGRRPELVPQGVHRRLHRAVQVARARTAPP